MANDNKYVRLYPERAVAPLREMLESLRDDSDLSWTPETLREINGALDDLEHLGFPPEEPLFLLRGQDAIAPDTVRFYFDRLRMLGASFDAEHAAEHAAAMQRWQPRKMPD